MSPPEPAVLDGQCRPPSTGRREGIAVEVIARLERSSHCGPVAAADTVPGPAASSGLPPGDRVGIQAGGEGLPRTESWRVISGGVWRGCSLWLPGERA